MILCVAAPMCSWSWAKDKVKKKIGTEQTRRDNGGDAMFYKQNSNKMCKFTWLQCSLKCLPLPMHERTN